MKGEKKEEGAVASLAAIHAEGGGQRKGREKGPEVEECSLR